MIEFRFSNWHWVPDSPVETPLFWAVTDGTTEGRGATEAEAMASFNKLRAQARAQARGQASVSSPP